MANLRVSKVILHTHVYDKNDEYTSEMEMVPGKENCGLLCIDINNIKESIDLNIISFLNSDRKVSESILTSKSLFVSRVVKSEAGTFVDNKKIVLEESHVIVLTVSFGVPEIERLSKYQIDKIREAIELEVKDRIDFPVKTPVCSMYTGVERRSGGDRRRRQFIM